jgi:hypothetical protein
MGSSLCRRLVPVTQILHGRSAPCRLQNFFASTSWSMVLSRLSSATSCFKRTFSSCTCFRGGPDLYFQANKLLLPAIEVCSAIPAFANHLRTGTPTSACSKIPTICSTENRFLFMAKSSF